jgi:hypothetical protein
VFGLRQILLSVLHALRELGFERAQIIINILLLISKILLLISSGICLFLFLFLWCLLVLLWCLLVQTTAGSMLIDWLLLTWLYLLLINLNMRLIPFLVIYRDLLIDWKVLVYWHAGCWTPWELESLGHRQRLFHGHSREVDNTGSAIGIGLVLQSLLQIAGFAAYIAFPHVLPHVLRLPQILFRRRRSLVEIAIHWLSLHRLSLPTSIQIPPIPNLYHCDGLDSRLDHLLLFSHFIPLVPHLVPHLVAHLLLLLLLFLLLLQNRHFFLPIFIIHPRLLHIIHHALPQLLLVAIPLRFPGYFLVFFQKVLEVFVDSVSIQWIFRRIQRGDSGYLEIPNILLILASMKSLILIHLKVTLMISVI